MSITIKQRGEGFRLCIDGEEWECRDREHMENILKVLLDMKTKQGRVEKMEINYAGNRLE